MSIAVDFTRPPTEKERLKLESRIARLENQERIEQITRACALISGKALSRGVNIRSGFSYRGGSPETGASDRKAPPRVQRPPATRIATSRGSALRFALMLLAFVQTKRKPGAKAQLSEFGLTVGGHSSETGWIDFLATDAVSSRNSRVFLTARDKRARSVRSALVALENAGLVFLSDELGTRNRFDGFVLLNESGREAIGGVEEYRVPRSSERTFTMPAGFVESGWVHVLEDSEIALLLMVACREGGWIENDLVAIPADVRLVNYGIHRDGFSSARKTLEWCGLLRVEEVGRHDDGRAEESDFRVHRLGILPAGFDEPAITTVTGALRRQVARG